MKYGYIRISTAKQKDNTSLEAQAEQILGRYPDAIIVSEVYSGAKKRPKFEELVDKMQAGDMLICTKLDRFCRDTREGLEYIDKLREKGCSVHLFDVGLIEDTPTGRLIVGIFLAFAEFERAKTIERTTEGKEKARQNPNFRDGRPPKFKKAQLDHAVNLLQYYSLSQVEDMTGISVSTIKRYKRKLITEKNVR